MYWYLEKDEDRPRAFLKKVAGMIESGEIEKIPGPERVKITETAMAWDRARGKNLFQPNKKTYWWFLQPHWIKGLRGGNQSGKTSSCTMEMVMLAEGWHPLQKANMERIIEEGIDPRVVDWLKKLYERKLWVSSPPLKMRCNAVDYGFVARINGPEYEKWLTHDDVDEIAYEHDKKRRIRWKNGSFVEFLTYDQPVLSHGGAPRDVIQHDEEPSSALWAQSRMRVATTDGRLILGMTAEQGVTWTDKEIWRPGLTHQHPTIYCTQISTYDNPVNSQAMIDKIKESCTDEVEVAIRIYGEAKPRGGLVYAMAEDGEPWVIDPFQIPKDKGYLIRAIDPHPQLPHAVLWIWVDFEGIKHDLFMNLPYLYEVAELFETGGPTDLAAMIKEKERYELGRPADFELCDPFAWNTDQNNPSTLADQFIAAGLNITKATKDREAGIVKVKEMLSLQLGKDLPEDREKAVVLHRPYPQIMTFKHLEVLRDERRRYRWKKPRMRFTEDVPVAQKPVDKDDHMMENEYRIALFVVNGDFDMVEMDVENASAPITYNGVELDVNFADDDVNVAPFP